MLQVQHSKLNKIIHKKYENYDTITVSWILYFANCPFSWLFENLNCVI